MKTGIDILLASKLIILDSSLNYVLVELAKDSK